MLPFGCGILLEQPLEPLEVAPGVLSQCFVAGKVCLRQMHRRIKRPRIDAEEKVPRFDVLALAEVYPGQMPVYAQA